MKNILQDIGSRYRIEWGNSNLKNKKMCFKNERDKGAVTLYCITCLYHWNKSDNGQGWSYIPRNRPIRLALVY